MSNIHEHLKELRIAKGLTQDEVADKIGLTRQAISGYESGKRQPGIDILMQLSALYEVDIETIVYGQKDAPKQKSAVKYLAIIVAAVFLCLQLLSGLLLTLAYILYPIEPGHLPPNTIDILQNHIALTRYATAAEQIAFLLLHIGSLLVLAIDLTAKLSFSWKQKVIFFLLTLGASWSIAIFWGIVHPVFGLMEFITKGPIYFAIIAIPLTINLAIWKIRKK